MLTVGVKLLLSILVGILAFAFFAGAVNGTIYRGCVLGCGTERARRCEMAQMQREELAAHPLPAWQLEEAPALARVDP